jgi:protein-S-isoprenylcysteine O-methyltransferase Ste14
MKRFPPIWLLLGLIGIAVLHRYLPLAEVVPAPWHFVGLAIGALGLALGFWTVSLFWRSRTTLIPGEESAALVTDGPFRFTRNPIYVGMVLLLLGACVFAGSLSPFGVLPVFIFIVQAWTITGEEAMLTQRFGASYTDYCRRVRRWV